MGAAVRDLSHCTALYRVVLRYTAGDYSKAAQLVRQLIAEPQLRQQLSIAGRREVELFGWSAATRVLREQQYARAVKLSIGKRRFWLLALRVRLARLFRAVTGLLAACWQLLIRRMDYARDFRSSGPAGPSVGLAT
jgi:glycosyltransferase involved in cell wall biosynthesis